MNLKDLANKAKNRLLNKGLRDTYSNANVLSCTSMNFFNQDKDNVKEIHKSENPLKYLLREDKMMSITSEDKERLILNSIRKYQEEKRKQEKDII